MNKLREEAVESKHLADRRAELLQELESEHRMILKENAAIRDRNESLYSENRLLRQFITERDLSEDFEDWAGTLLEVTDSMREAVSYTHLTLPTIYSV